MKIERTKIKPPKVGDEIYVGTSYYISHGEDDFVGGKATIDRVILNYDCRNLYNQIMVVIKERPSTEYNYTYLLEKQEEWKREFGDSVSHPEPDYNDYGEDW